MKPILQTVVAVVLLIGVTAYADGITDRMSLNDAIESLRQDGINISYSSRLVKPWMRVRTAPASANPVDALREALAEYALALEPGPQGEWLVVQGEPVKPVAVAGIDQDEMAFRPGPEYPYEIDEVKIVASRYSLYDQESTSDQFLTGEEIRLLPHVMDDVFRAFHRLPGVAATDFSAPFHLRGGKLDEVKVELDGLELFEPYHMQTLFSPISIIDAGIINNAQVLSGGFTANHGNRMSGIIEISSMWTNTEPVYEAGVSFVNAFVRGSGAWGERGAFQFAARRGYLDLVADAVAVGDEKFTPRYHDVFAGAAYSISDSTIIDTHVLLASDHVKYTSVDEGEYGESKSSQKYFWVTFDSEPNDDLNWVNTISTGRVKNNDQGSAQNFPSEVIDRFYNREVEVTGLTSDLSLRLTDSQLLMFGLRYRHLEADFDYQIDSFRQSNLFNDGIPLVINRDIDTSSNGNEYGVYARYRFQPTARSTWEIGLRWDKQTYTDTSNDTQLSPRLNGLFDLGERTELRVGWGYYYQPQGIEELQVEDGITHYYPAEQARHLVAGIRHWFKSDLELQVDIYQKRYSDLRPRYENALDTFDYAAETDFDRIRIDPTSAKSRGMEITLRNRQSDRFDWWFNYTWSKADDNIEGISVPRSWDQRHAVTGNLTWYFDQWILSLAGRYHSGWPQTPLLVTPVLDAGGALVGVDAELSGRNQSNYDDYLRIDMRLSRTINLKRGSFQFYVEIYNLLNTKNQCCVADYELVYGPPLTASPNIDDYLPFFPSFGFVWTFGPGAG